MAGPKFLSHWIMTRKSFWFRRYCSAWHWCGSRLLQHFRCYTSPIGVEVVDPTSSLFWEGKEVVWRHPVGLDVQSWVVLTVIRGVVIGVDGWFGHVGLHQEVTLGAWQRFSYVVTPRDVGTWVGDELEAQPKEGTKIGWWFLLRSKVVKCQVGGLMEVAPN
jgi:hypothetical protein